MDSRTLTKILWWLIVASIGTSMATILLAVLVVMDR